MTDAGFPAAALRRHLVAGRNPDGGWGYYAGKGSRLEPTCWALLALRDADPAPLARWPSAAGLLPERPGGAVNFGFHALALLTLAGRGVEHAETNARLAAELQSARGLALEPTPINRQNNGLQGWSWMAGTFSWVEPTAWSLLALRSRATAGQPVDRARLDEADALLVDRCCEQGGWNYGNSNMLGKELRPYVPTTALALLALQASSAPAVPPVVSKSLRYLEGAATSEPSAVALSLAVLALGAFGRPSGAARDALTAQAGRTLDLGQQLGMAMALRAVATPITTTTTHPDGPFIL